MSVEGSENRYDRQLRLWGDHGQAALHQAHVCLIGSTGPGTETLKSLVLPGIATFTIIDDALVTDEDLGNNFLVSQDSLGKFRSLETTNWLLELNPNVKGHALTVSPADVTNSAVQQTLDKATVVISSCLPDKLNLLLIDECKERSVPLVVCAVYGFIAYLRIYFDDHVIMESHRENVPPDMRLDRPFDSLNVAVGNTVLDNMNHQQHSHTPFIFVLFKALDRWRIKHNKQQTELPQNFAEKKELKSIILAMQMPDDKGRIDEMNFNEAMNAVNTAVHPTTLPDRVKRILDDVCTSDQYISSINKSTHLFALKFWILVRALKQFVDKNGVLPVKGSLPDMTADSASYVQLQKIFHNKAQGDAVQVHETALQLIKTLRLDIDLQFEQSQMFCKHSTELHVLRQKYEVTPTFRETVLNALKNDDACMCWYVLLRAAEKFNLSKGRYPGTNGIPVPLDKIDLANRVKVLSEEWGIPDLVTLLDDDKLFEMCRYGACQPHVVSSWVGGCVSQEVIKLITHQYIPLNNTLIFDANSASASTFLL